MKSLLQLTVANKILNYLYFSFMQNIPIYINIYIHMKYEQNVLSRILKKKRK